jgi:hypothetical protein
LFCLNAFETIQAIFLELPEAFGTDNDLRTKNFCAYNRISNPFTLNAFRTQRFFLRFLSKLSVNILLEVL